MIFRGTHNGEIESQTTVTTRSTYITGYLINDSENDWLGYRGVKDDDPNGVYTIGEMSRFIGDDTSDEAFENPDNWVPYYGVERYIYSEKLGVYLKDLTFSSNWESLEIEVEDFPTSGYSYMMDGDDKVVLENPRSVSIISTDLQVDPEGTQYVIANVWHNFESTERVCTLTPLDGMQVLDEDGQTQPAYLLTPVEGVDRDALSPVTIDEVREGLSDYTITTQDFVYNGGGLIYGDINGDQTVNASDALLALQHSVKLKTLEGDSFTAADVNGDESVNASDALLILQYSVKLISKFPVEQ